MSVLASSVLLPSLSPSKSKRLADITLENLASWDSQALDWQRLIPFDQPILNRDILVEEVNAGLVAVCSINKDGERIGLLAYSTFDGEIKELEIVAVYISDPDFSYSNAINEIAEQLAKSLDCSSIRFRTIRSPIISLACSLGYRVSEVILRKRL